MAPWLRWQGAPCATLHVGKHLLNYAYRLRCVHYNMHKCDEMEEHLEWVMPPPHPHLMRGKLLYGPIIKNNLGGQES